MEIKAKVKESAEGEKLAAIAGILSFGETLANYHHMKSLYLM
jgi:hypothetical protein